MTTQHDFNLTRSSHTPLGLIESERNRRDAARRLQERRARFGDYEPLRTGAVLSMIAFGILLGLISLCVSL